MSKEIGESSLFGKEQQQDGTLLKKESARMAEMGGVRSAVNFKELYLALEDMNMSELARDIKVVVSPPNRNEVMGSKTRKDVFEKLEQMLLSDDEVHNEIIEKAKKLFGEYRE